MTANDSAMTVRGVLTQADVGDHEQPRRRLLHCLHGLLHDAVIAALHEVVAPESRGIATGLYFFLVHMLGDAISPAIVGWIADASGARVMRAIGVPRVGHFGFFRAAMKEPLWDGLLRAELAIRVEDARDRLAGELGSG